MSNNIKKDTSEIWLLRDIRRDSNCFIASLGGSRKIEIRVVYGTYSDIKIEGFYEAWELKRLFEELVIIYK